MRIRFKLGAGVVLVLTCGFALPALADEPRGAVEGAITDALGRPLTDVVVSLKAADGSIAASGKTDAMGHFSLNAAPGRYELSADKASFVHGSNVVEIREGAATSTTLALAGNEALAIKVKAKKLERARNDISSQTGSSVYRMSSKDIQSLPQGESTAFNQVLLQAPGVAQDSYGQLHVRGDHGDLQYRINGIILPESISGFGQTLDTRFAQSVNLLTGALPAQYGYRTAGVVDIQTKSGAFANGGNIGVMAGSYGTQELHGDVSGNKDNFNYYLSGSLLRSDIGIENPTSSKNPLHDHTDQGKGFAYLSWLMGDNSKLSVLTGTTNNRFQIPDVPGQVAKGIASESLDDRQRETTHYGIVAFQSTVGDDFDYQMAVFTRYTDVHFRPDIAGELAFNNVASTVARSVWANGVQADSSYRLNPAHTIRVGAFLSRERLISDSDILAFPADANGNPTSTTPVSIQDNGRKNASLAGVYAQDEWKATEKLTVNYGTRFDQVNAFVRDSQLSPRLGAVYQMTPATVLHAGYARYFTPPPTELVSTQTIAASQGTTAAPPTSMNDPVKSESSDYYDVGVSHQWTPQLTVGLDTYYKKIKNLLDEGQFGSALLFTPFNYAEGKVCGVELTTNYRRDNFNAYFNLARSTALGRDIVSSEYNFGQDELDYIASHWIHLDHDQMLTASGGVSYLWQSTTWGADLIAGSGLRRGFANTEHLPGYTQMNLSAARTFKTTAVGNVEGRISIINVLDRVYEIRDGTGVGVGAPQFGPRRGFYVGVDKSF